MEKSLKIVDARKKWSKIRLEFDGYEGWVDNKQFNVLTKDLYESLQKES